MPIKTSLRPSGAQGVALPAGGGTWPAPASPVTAPVGAVELRMVPAGGVAGTRPTTGP